jgi:hypothetical protein
MLENLTVVNSMIFSILTSISNWLGTAPMFYFIVFAIMAFAITIILSLIGVADRR